MHMDDLSLFFSLSLSLKNMHVDEDHNVKNKFPNGPNMTSVKGQVRKQLVLIAM